MKILAVESSCDETAVAVVEDGRTVLTDCIASQVALHRLYGGVVPELASRKHIEAIYALADEALSRASITRQEIDAIAVTYAPGLIGAVLVGVNFAKAAAYSLGVPLVPVHHIRGHIASMFGELMPDCGIYFLREGRSYLNEAEHKKILCNMKDYAICVVKLVWEKADED